MRVWLPQRTDRRCGPAAHTRPRAVSVCARVQLGAHEVRADTCERLPSAWTACGLAAGVPRCGCVQRGHRRVEHRVGHHVGFGMRRLFGPGGAPPQAGRARWVVGVALSVVRGGDRRCARVCACADDCGRCHHVRMRVYIRRNISPTHTSFIILYIYRCRVRVCKYYASVLLRTRAIACGR